jgi:hypothetical protein
MGYETLEERQAAGRERARYTRNRIIFFSILAGIAFGGGILLGRLFFGGEQIVFPEDYAPRVRDTVTTGKAIQDPQVLRKLAESNDRLAALEKLLGRNNFGATATMVTRETLKIKGDTEFVADTFRSHDTVFVIRHDVYKGSHKDKWSEWSMKAGPDSIALSYLVRNSWKLTTSGTGKSMVYRLVNENPHTVSPEAFVVAPPKTKPRRLLWALAGFGLGVVGTGAAALYLHR